VKEQLKEHKKKLENLENKINNLSKWLVIVKAKGSADTFCT
jgi:uncharacterized membrane protein YjjP (DUF1212 family)